MGDKSPFICEIKVSLHTILRATSQSFVDPPNERAKFPPYGAHPPNTETVSTRQGNVDGIISL